MSKYLVSMVLICVLSGCSVSRLRNSNDSSYDHPVTVETSHEISWEKQVDIPSDSSDFTAYLYDSIYRKPMSGVFVSYLNSNAHGFIITGDDGYCQIRLPKGQYAIQTTPREKIRIDSICLKGGSKTILKCYVGGTIHY